MLTNSSQPIKLFYCYARKDHALRDELDIHLAGLRRSGLITTWFDGEISPGIPWEKEIETQLETAEVILLLVSPDFIHSDYCYGKEMTRAIERHRAEEIRVIPVLLRPVDWTGTPFSVLQILPSNTRPVTRWSNRDEAFKDIARGIRRAVDDILAQRRRAPVPAKPAIEQHLRTQPTPNEELKGVLMVNVFISHRGADTDKAERLATDIRSRGHAVWLDKWAIDLGDSIIQRINEGLTSSNVVLLCLSSEGILSPWMSREWFSALARQLNGENVKLLPVRLSGGSPPAILADIKYADAVADYDAALSSILRALERVV